MFESREEPNIIFNDELLKPDGSSDEDPAGKSTDALALAQQNTSVSMAMDKRPSLTKHSILRISNAKRQLNQTVAIHDVAEYETMITSQEGNVNLVHTFGEINWLDPFPQIQQKE